MTERTTQETVAPGRTLAVEFDSMAFELGFDGTWRAYDPCGLVAVAPSFRELYERMGGVWH